MRFSGPIRRPSRFRNFRLEALEARELPATTVGEFPIRPTGGLALAVAPGADGSLYAVLDSSNVARLDPGDSTDTAQYPIPTYNGGAGPMVQASDGNLWFWQTNLNQFAYLDPRARKVTEVPLWWTPKTGQFGDLDLLRAFSSDRSGHHGSIHFARGTVVQSRRVDTEYFII